MGNCWAWMSAGVMVMTDLLVCRCLRRSGSVPSRGRALGPAGALADGVEEDVPDPAGIRRLVGGSTGCCADRGERLGPGAVAVGDADHRHRLPGRGLLAAQGGQQLVQADA